MPYEKLFQLEKSQKKMSIENDYLARKSKPSIREKERNSSLRSTGNIKGSVRQMVSQPILQYPTVRNVKIDVEKLKQMCNNFNLLNILNFEEGIYTGGGFNLGPRSKYNSLYEPRPKTLSTSKRIMTESQAKI